MEERRCSAVNGYGVPIMANSRRQKVTPTKEKTFGQNDDLGVSKEPARRDHTHGTQDNPTSSHVAESDPHPQYLKKDQTVRQTIHSGMPLVEGFVFSETPTTVTTEAGTARWNADEDTLDIHGNGQVTQVGQELAPLYKNQTGSTITNGTPVMFAGAVGASGRLKIQGAIADGSLPAKYIIGLATQDIANGDDGHATWFGKVRGIDTTGTPYGEVWAAGDILYVSPTTAGELTNVAPNAPDLQITVAAVVNAHATQGSLFIRPTFESKFCELDDVNGTALTTDGQIPVWDQTAGYFDFTENINDYHKLPLYGHMTNDSGTTVTVAVSGTWYEVTAGFATGELNGVTFGGSHYLQVSEAGKYLVNVNASLEGATGGDKVGVAAAINGTEQTAGYAHSTIGNASDQVGMGTSYILDLAADDQVSLTVVNQTAARDLDVIHASVTLNRISN